MWRPMIVAPTLALARSTTSELAFDLTAVQPVHRAPDGERKHPLVQAHAADPERVRHALIGAGRESVE